MTKVWYENPAGTAPAQGLYSHAGLVQGGTLAFIAGQLAVGPAGEVVGKGDLDKQFAQVFTNLGDVLKGLKTDYSHIVKFTTYLVHSQDIENFSTADLLAVNGRDRMPRKRGTVGGALRLAEGGRTGDSAGEKDRQ